MGCFTVCSSALLCMSEWVALQLIHIRMENEVLAVLPYKVCQNGVLPDLSYKVCHNGVPTIMSDTKWDTCSCLTKYVRMRCLQFSPTKYVRNVCFSFILQRMSKWDVCSFVLHSMSKWGACSSVLQSMSEWCACNSVLQRMSKRGACSSVIQSVSKWCACNSVLQCQNGVLENSDLQSMSKQHAGSFVLQSMSKWHALVLCCKDCQNGVLAAALMTSLQWMIMIGRLSKNPDICMNQKTMQAKTSLSLVMAIRFFVATLTSHVANSPAA